jgi:hypothetical protein
MNFDRLFEASEVIGTQAFRPIRAACDPHEVC